MRVLKFCPDIRQINALLCKDILVRWRLWWMTLVQLVWPCMVFMLFYLIRLKFGPEFRDNCQFPTRQLPTKNNVLESFYSIICTLENKCMNTQQYEEYTKFDKAPMKPVIEIVQTFINDKALYNAILELPEKHSFINTVTTLVSGGHMNEIRDNIQKVIAMVPDIEVYLNGSFDIKKMFSDRKTFVKSGYLLCGQPFPDTETIPLVNDILYSDDFSEVSDDELKAMPTKYCKKLYLDVTSTNQGKLTWSVIKPIIHGKILYAPNNEETNSIMRNSNTTFEELGKLKNLSIALEQIFFKLRTDEEFQQSLDSLLLLVDSPFVRNLIGDEINIEEIKAVIERMRTDPVIYDVIATIKNILECLSVDRFVAADSEQDLRSTSFELNKKRLFYAAIYFNETDSDNVVYKLHVDTDKTQPTLENKNRFWFPGPNGDMLLDMKYHRGFVQIKQTLDIGIIKHKKQQLGKLGLLVKPSTTTKSPFKVEVLGDDDLAFDYDDDDDDWFASENDTMKNKDNNTSMLSSSIFSGFLPSMSTQDLPQAVTTTESAENITEISQTYTTALPLSVDGNIFDELMSLELPQNATEQQNNSNSRVKRQGLFDLFDGLMSRETEDVYEIDQMKYFTKQFPYPAYVHDDFKTGLYLGQAIQVGFFLGLVAQILSCVRHRIWMRESKNSMMMRCMGLKSSSEIYAWIIITSIELIIIFASVLFILYVDGILHYTSCFFLIFYLLIFGSCLLSFCYMCSTFFTSAVIGAVGTSIIFFISFCPYIIVLLFDATLNTWQYFGINLCFTTAFAHGWNHIMRMEVQQNGLTFSRIWALGLESECGFAMFMMVLDLIIYIIIGKIVQRLKNDEYQFIELERSVFDANIGAKLSNVCKVYSDGIVAADYINLLLPRNQVTCLLGRNGAGKSTIIKMLTGQIVQTSGKVELAQTAQNSKNYDKVGLCAQNNILIPELTAREHLELYGKIKLRENYVAEVNKTLKSLNFDKYESYKVSNLSGGYQRRLCVALAFLGSPNVVILDEPCNCVDIRARKDIWDLVKSLQHGRAVVLATHFLDEAEYLSDNIIIMKKGSIIATHTPHTLQEYSTKNYELIFKYFNEQTAFDVRKMAAKSLTGYQERTQENKTNELCFEIGYEQKYDHSAEFISYLEQLQMENQISELKVKGKNLEHLFKNIDTESNMRFAKTHIVSPLKEQHAVSNKKLTSFAIIQRLLWKRFVHFSRNYRMLLAVLVLPAIFELIAMWFVAFRVEDDYDKVLRLSRDLYPHSKQFLAKDSIQNNFVTNLYDNLAQECNVEKSCDKYNSSESLFYWLLNTSQEYLENRYGGYSLNNTNAIVWYNNKGYHALVAWLNDFNSYLMQTELNNTKYTITAYNEPWKLEFAELSTTSMLRQIGDSCMAFVLLIAFSLIVAVSVVYLVTERVKGEKLQQRLCGVNVTNYWLVAFLWDYLILILGICICTVIMLCFNMPVFVARQQLIGFIVLILFYGIACIPAMHVFEKCFSDASVAIVTVFCMNVILPMFTMALIVLLGVIGDSSVWDDWRFFLNRAFLIFPQHALGDGLLELCKNYMVALVFLRYDIDSYKHPLLSDLLRPHFIALFAIGAFFALLNVCLECGIFNRWQEQLKSSSFWQRKHDQPEELKTISIASIQNTLTRHDYKISAASAVEVDNLSKYFARDQMVLRNISFDVQSGECLGLLGRNGAGKSTLFKILSGQMQPTSGTVDFANKEISYCPQTNTMDDLLTVRECLEFYARLRRIINIPKFVQSMLQSFQLEPEVLVKNLSGGNRRKLTVATTCCGQTSVVLMDEPTSDMDLMTRAVVYRVIHELLDEGRAVILTSHTISEIDDVCQRILVLKQGQLLLMSTPQQLKLDYGSFYSVSIYCDINQTSAVIKEIQQRFPKSVNLMVLPHIVSFQIKVRQFQENEVKSMQNGKEFANADLTLADLFQSLTALVEEYDNSLRYMISHCRLDAIFENVLDSNASANKYKGYTSPAGLNGNLSSGYIHNGYIETETAT